MRMLRGSEQLGCFSTPTSHLLVSLRTGAFGVVQNPSIELRRVRLLLNRTTLALKALQGRAGALVQRRLKSLRKRKQDLRTLRQEILACTDGSGITGLSVSCLGLPDKTPCDDSNPCTTSDSCLSGVCVSGKPSAIATVQCGSDVCATTIAQCSVGTVTVCYEKSLGTELCNGLDDDCNGSIDDGCSQAPPTPTNSQTPSPTGTPTASPTQTPSPTPTSTPTAPPTQTATPTQTPTPTPTPIPCLGSSQTFDLPGPFADVSSCVGALIAAATNRCCVGSLNPGGGFVFGVDPALCRGICQ